MQKTGDYEDMTSEDDGRGNDDREEMELDITSLVCSGGQFNAMLRLPPPTIPIAIACTDAVNATNLRRPPFRLMVG